MAGTEGSSDAGDGLREIGAGYLQDIAALRRRDEVSGQNEDVPAPEEER
ncbi:hypothetical protein Sros01_81170 [Streptomyces roseochromogenus]|nr:hypothetical protein Sros01_81170 [Streptomyces roseochromogenus]